MLNWIKRNIKGDKITWAIILIFTLFSFLAVYSASTNLVYVIGKGTTFGHFVRHGVIITIGFMIIYVVHKIPYRFARPISKLGLWLSAILLIFAALRGTTIDGANASRWIKVPFVGISFQPSTFALVVLMVYVASYLAENYDKKRSFKDSLLPLWTPVMITIALIIPSNLSTALLVATSVGILAFIGRYAIKHLSAIVLIGIIGIVFLFLLAKAFPDAFPNRVDTWISRIESFASSDDEKEGYQIERAKMAIAKGGFLGEGAGKSTMKNFLPQSSSDFIYAIITEEYGSLGAIMIMILYMVLLVRILIISQNAKTLFGRLLVLGVGFPIVLQALINMGVAVEVLPVTGQNLPLISSGGTSIWMTCLALGLILSVSTNKRQKNQQMEKDKRIEEVEEELAEGIMEEVNKNKKI